MLRLVDYFIPFISTPKTCADTPAFWQTMSNMDEELLAMQIKLDALKEYGSRLMHEQAAQAAERPQEKKKTLDEIRPQALELLARGDQSWELGYVLKNLAEVVIEDCKRLKAGRNTLVEHALKTGTCQTDGKAAQATDEKEFAKVKQVGPNTRRTKETEARPDQSSSCTRSRLSRGERVVICHTSAVSRRKSRSRSRCTQTVHPANVGSMYR
ncbi:hypothetical protein F5I97DRAFT_1022961 [Phlebopus sp. FC_14]|nr:hypothetical protein F5I97DRAFT_1022961 [Phlebopus sp. FC_14]